MKSHAFKDLLGQCQELLRYASSLQEKLKISNDRIVEIERSREKELRELKRKYDAEKLSVNTVATHNINLKIVGREIGEFKADIARAMAPVRELYEKSIRSEEQNMDLIKNVYNNVENMKRENEDLRKKILEYEADMKPAEP